MQRLVDFKKFIKTASIKNVTNFYVKWFENHWLRCQFSTKMWRKIEKKIHFHHAITNDLVLVWGKSPKVTERFSLKNYWSNLDKIDYKKKTKSNQLKTKTNQFLLKKKENLRKFYENFLTFKKIWIFYLPLPLFLIIFPTNNF